MQKIMIVRNKANKDFIINQITEQRIRLRYVFDVQKVSYDENYLILEGTPIKPPYRGEGVSE
jgi:hypothetical protein